MPKTRQKTIALYKITTKIRCSTNTVGTFSLLGPKFPKISIVGSGLDDVVLEGGGVVLLLVVGVDGLEVVGDDTLT